MKKLTVFITGSEKIVHLKESIVTNAKSCILLKKAYVFWEMVNVTKDSFYKFNNKFDQKLDSGYYTFHDIKNILESNGDVTVTLDTPSATCRIVTGGTTTLTLHSTLSSILGFIDTVFLPGTDKGGGIINVNNGLKYLRVTLDTINTGYNFEDGEKSNLLVNLPAMSTQRLYGSTQSFKDIESKVNVDRGTINTLQFNVTDQDWEPLDDYGSILLELYIT